MNKPDASWQYVERYLAFPREHVVGKGRTSICVRGYRKDEKFWEIRHGALAQRALNEEFLMDDIEDCIPVSIPVCCELGHA